MRVCGGAGWNRPQSGRECGRRRNHWRKMSPAVESACSQCKECSNCRNEPHSASGVSEKAHRVVSMKEPVGQGTVVLASLA